MKQHISMRRAVAGTACATIAGLLLAACASSDPDPTASGAVGVDAKGPSGDIRILAVEGPETDALATHATEFTESSGIGVTVDKVGRDVWGQRKVAELAQDAGTYDIVFVGGGDDAEWLLRHAHAQDLSQYLEDGVAGDIVNSDLFTRDDGALVGAPQYYNFPVLLYRKDLFEDPTEQANFKAEYGRDLAPPTTFDEFVDVATFFNRGPDLYGTCLGGVDWSVFLDDTYFTYGQGGNFGDLDTGELTLNTPEHINAMEYIDKLTSLSAPGWEAQSFFDCDNQMVAGQVAIYQNWLYAWRTVGDQMDGNLGIAPPPGEQTHLGSMLATIPDAAPNPDAAGAFVSWMVSDQYQLEQTSETGNLPVLASQQDDPAFASALPELDMLKTVADRLTYLHTTWSGELGSGVSEGIAKVLSGEMTAEEAAAWLQDEKFAGRKAIE